VTFFEKLQSLLVVVAVLVGLALGKIAWVADGAASLIVPFLMVMLYGVFLHVPLSGLGKAFQSIKFTGTSLAINFLWTPVFAWGLGAIFLRDTPDLWVGFIMLMVTPCTDWYLVFTSIARGNVTLATSLLPWNLTLQIVLLPFYLLIFAGALVSMDPVILFKSVMLVLVGPLVLAFISRRLIVRAKGEAWLEDRLLPKVTVGQILFLSFAIAAMFASQGNTLLQRPEVLLILLVPVVLFFVINFMLGQWAGRLLKFSYDQVACLNCTTLARNSPIALAIAVTAFPDRPLIALALVIGPLIELPILAAVSQLLLLIRGNGWWPHARESR